MDITLLHKKLQAAWSAGTITKSISTPTSIDEIRHNFDKFDKKTKMRIILSMIAMDVRAKQECAIAINRLLELAAQETKTDIVSVLSPGTHVIISSSSYPPPFSFQ